MSDASKIHLSRRNGIWEAFWMQFGMPCVATSKDMNHAHGAAVRAARWMEFESKYDMTRQQGGSE